jgi:riboflavin synthase
MYTGIVLGQARISDIHSRANFLQYAVDVPSKWLHKLAIGASVAIDGVCQSVVRIEDQQVWFDAIEETLRVTTLGELSVGQFVNIERSLRLGDELGGHQTYGHVIGCGSVVKRLKKENNFTFQIGVNPDWMRYIFPKGFIAMDGVSLTVGEVSSNNFTVHLIPETLRTTTLGQKEVGDKLNIEVDQQTQAIVLTVERTLRATKT